MEVEPDGLDFRVFARVGLDTVVPLLTHGILLMLGLFD